MKWLLDALAWLLERLLNKPAPTPDAVIVTNAPAEAKAAGATEQKLADQQQGIKDAEVVHAQQSAAADVAADAQRRVVLNPSAIDSDPSGHWRD